jgi:hypothetical protein
VSASATAVSHEEFENNVGVRLACVARLPRVIRPTEVSFITRPKSVRYACSLAKGVRGSGFAMRSPAAGADGGGGGAKGKGAGGLAD